MRRSLLRATRRIRSFAEHPATKFGVGVLMVLTALYEIEEGLLVELAEQGPGAHHGVAGYGLLTIVSALPDLLEGAIASTVSYEQLEQTANADGT